MRQLIGITIMLAGSVGYCIYQVHTFNKMFEQEVEPKRPKDRYVKCKVSDVN